MEIKESKIGDICLMDVIIAMTHSLLLCACGFCFLLKPISLLLDKLPRYSFGVYLPCIFGD